MPPRHTYWTIILEGQPTAFRARTPDELAPTLRQLQSRHPDAVMKWFSRGRLWTSPEEERLARTVRGAAHRTRGPGWRPGGSHQDPRERFKVPRDEKRRRFAQRLRRERGETDRTGTGSADAGQRREPARARPHGPRPPWVKGSREGGRGRFRPSGGGSAAGGRPPGKSGPGRGPRGGGRGPRGGGGSR